MMSTTKKHATFVYWNVSCLPVNVASIDCGAVSISQIPSAVHCAEHECSSLFDVELLRYKDTLDNDKPAEVNSAVFQAMKMVRIRTESLAKSAGERAKSSFTQMLVMIHVTATNEVSEGSGAKRSFDDLPCNTTSTAARGSGSVTQPELR
jgi:hypothetical protein